MTASGSGSTADAGARHVAPHRTAIGEALAAAPGLLLALDFDGTLAPIVENPDDATMDAAVREHLARLAAAPTVEPVVVSGRELTDLRERVGIEGIDYAGNHGLERRVDGDRRVPDVARHCQDAIDAVCADLIDRIGDVPGCEIENKGLTATVHLRQVPLDRRDFVIQMVREAVRAAEGDLAISEGKAIREIRPPIEWDKGRAVEAFAERVPDDWLRIYVGDDVTDEDAFAALAAMDGDALSVVVGDRADTAADYRLDGQDAVPDFLSFVLENR